MKLTTWTTKRMTPELYHESFPADAAVVPDIGATVVASIDVVGMDDSDGLRCVVCGFDFAVAVAAAAVVKDIVDGPCCVYDIRREDLGFQQRSL